MRGWGKSAELTPCAQEIEAKAIGVSAASGFAICACEGHVAVRAVAVAAVPTVARRSLTASVDYSILQASWSAWIL